MPCRNLSSNYGTTRTLDQRGEGGEGRGGLKGTVLKTQQSLGHNTQAVRKRKGEKGLKGKRAPIVVHRKQSYALVRTTRAMYCTYPPALSSSLEYFEY